MLCSACNVLYGTVGVIVLTLVLGWWMNGFFRRRGVKSPPAYLPLIGHMLPAIRQQMHYMDFVNFAYNIYPGERYVGIMQFTKRLVCLRDLDLIKQVAIKDFDHFTDHVSSSSEENADPIFGHTLINLRGQKWKDMRATLSPAFTSSKIKAMFQLVNECGEQMEDYYVKAMEKDGNEDREIIEIELKEEFMRYTNDVIATCAFGLRVDSFTERNNDFFMTGKKLTDFTGIVFFKLLFVSFFPRLARMFDVTFFPKKLTDFYRNLVWGTIKDREEHHIYRPDMIHLLNEAKKGALKHEPTEEVKECGFAAVEESAIGKSSVKREWTDDDIVAQAVLFMVAGFETTTTVLSYLLHELAVHHEIQKKLQEEIDEVWSSGEEKLTYESLQKMKYMDMVVSELLRLWPPNPNTDRECVKDYVMPPPNDKSKPFCINRGVGVWIPIYAIQHDPEYWKDPDVFDPERFSDVNKEKIKPFTYLPFGVGPRNCIGSRFALLVVKSVTFSLLRNFDVISTSKTRHPIKMRKDTFQMLPEGGFWVGLQKRQRP